jgi:hypothetical protein
MSTPDETQYDDQAQRDAEQPAPDEGNGQEPQGEPGEAGGEPQAPDEEGQ